jgi:hypothetical protein
MRSNCHRNRSHRDVARSLIVCLLLFVCIVLTLACGVRDEAKYVGEWQDIQRESFTFRIYKTGDTYIMESNFPGRGVEKYPAVFRDGQLKVAHPMGETPVVHIEATDHLLYGGDEYKRKT